MSSSQFAGTSLFLSLGQYDRQGYICRSKGFFTLQGFPLAVDFFAAGAPCARAQLLTEISAITKATIAAGLLIIAIFSDCIMLEALFLDSARNGFFRLFYCLLARAALPGYLGPGDGRDPLPKVALNALHNGEFDPAIEHGDCLGVSSPL